MKIVKRFVKRILKNIKYFLSYDLYEHELERTYEIQDKIVEDLFFEFEENKYIINNLNIIDAEESINLLMENPKSFCRFGDGEIGIMQGKNQPFQKYDEKLANGLKDILSKKRDDMYVAINRAYFHSPLVWAERNKKFYRIYGTQMRRFFIEICNPDVTYLDAGCMCAYFRYKEDFDYEKHYSRMENLFKNKKIAIVSGTGILEKLEFDVFYLAEDKIIIHGPATNAFEKIDDIIKHIQNNIPKDYLICIILGMTAKVLVAELTDMGYMAWDVGHLAKDYDVFMRKVEKTEDNRAEFWKPD